MSRFSNDGDEEIELEGVIKRESDKAYLFEPDYGEEGWVPKTACTVVPDLDSDEPGRATILVKVWKAKQNKWT